MPIKIENDLMRLEVLGTARKRGGGWWQVSYWPRFFERNQPITSVTITELLDCGHDANDPLVRALHEELR